MNTPTDALVDQGLRVALDRMKKAERKCADLQTSIEKLCIGANHTERYAGELRAENNCYRELLRQAQEMRPALLKQYGIVPECVLAYCNVARAALKTIEGKTNPVAWWADLTSTPIATIYARLGKGWNSKDAVFQPVDKKKRNGLCKRT